MTNLYIWQGQDRNVKQQKELNLSKKIRLGEIPKANGGWKAKSELSSLRTK